MVVIWLERRRRGARIHCLALGRAAAVNARLWWCVGRGGQAVGVVKAQAAERLMRRVHGVDSGVICMGKEPHSARGDLHVTSLLFLRHSITSLPSTPLHLCTVSSLLVYTYLPKYLIIILVGKVFEGLYAEKPGDGHYELTLSLLTGLPKMRIASNNQSCTASTGIGSNS